MPIFIVQHSPARSGAYMIQYTIRYESDPSSDIERN